MSKAKKPNRTPVPACCRPKKPRPGVCRYCLCTEADCSECVELTGEPCFWIGPSLCSACDTPGHRLARADLRVMLTEMNGPPPAKSQKRQRKAKK